MARTGDSNKRDGARVTVRLSEAEKNRLDAVCAPTRTRGPLKPSAVIRAALADLTAEGFSADAETRDVVTGAGTNDACERVHLDEQVAHQLLVELGREGRNLMQIVARINSGRVVLDAEVMARLDAQLVLLRQVQEALGASRT